MLRRSSRTYATPLRLEPVGSRTLWRLELLLHAVTLPVVLTLPLPAAAALAALLCCSLARSWRRRAMRAPGALRSLTWQDATTCRVVLRNGRTLAATLEPRVFVRPWLVILYYRTGRWRVQSLLLLPDMLDAVTWRRLRVRLNTGLNPQDEAVAGR